MGLRIERMRIVQEGFTLDADLAVARGARVAVIGPSGSGKSTLMGAIAGFVPLASGRILWGGADLARQPPGERPLSILFQDQNLFPHLTVADNVGLGLDPRLRLTAADRQRVAAVIARVGLAGKEGRRPAALSGGEQGRAALARVLVRARPLLLLDEAFAALGPVLPTPSHPGAPTLGWEGFARAVERTRVPVYALGGLRATDLAAAIDAGAHGVAMLRGAWPPA